MRKLKFRVWNWAFEGENAIPDVIEIKQGEFRPEGLLPEEAVVEQFTGLLDKNGKEIYEGDILKVTVGFAAFEGQPRRNWDYCDYVGPIEFESGCFRFIGKNEYGHGYSNCLCSAHTQGIMKSSATSTNRKRYHHDPHKQGRRSPRMVDRRRIPNAISGVIQADAPAKALRRGRPL